MYSHHGSDPTSTQASKKASTKERVRAQAFAVHDNVFSPWVYAPDGVTSSLNFVQGIGEGTRKNTYTIVGTYGQLNNGAVGVVYQGAINGTNTTQGSGPGTWTTIVVPTSFGSLGISIYGVHKNGNGNFN